ncbi:MAG: hypothetical protein Q9162_001186 [Coniocarpon cinnabarinum]
MAARMQPRACGSNFLRSLSKPAPCAAPRSVLLRCFSSASSISEKRLPASLARQTKPLALSTFRQPTSVVRYASSRAPGTVQRPDKEDKFAAEQLEANPELVSTGSSVHPIFSEVGQGEKEPDVDMMAGVRHDILQQEPRNLMNTMQKVIRDTFNLQAVPTEAFRIGMAGVLPYLATSTATVFAAFEYNNAAHMGGFGYFMSEHNAETLLHVLEPLQVGYGAVILSFLGAIHWGLEWAQYGGYGGYRRYAIGVIAPAVAWPTILLPVEYALISQFLAFNILYAVDSSTTKRGWTPEWYGTYRFILTFIVGASIVMSLIGRGQVSDRIGTMPTAAERVKEFADSRGKSTVGKKGKRSGSDED